MIALKDTAYFPPNPRIILKQSLHLPILMMLIMLFRLLEGLYFMRGEGVEKFLAGKYELDIVFNTERSSMMWRDILRSDSIWDYKDKQSSFLFCWA